MVPDLEVLKYVQDELLGAYVFCKRLGAAEAGSAAPPEGLALPRSAGHVLSTVSHFNLIHVKCHAAARRADSNRRAPKRCAMPRRALHVLHHADLEPACAAAEHTEGPCADLRTVGVHRAGTSET